MTSVDKIIAFQGMPGAHSDMACRAVFPTMETLPCRAFEDAFGAVNEGRARLAMIPIDNSVAGRVADIHHLLPKSGLHIVGEHFQRIDQCLLGVKGASMADLTHVHSHVHALGQCRNLIGKMGIEPIVHADTAGAAAMIAEDGDVTQGAISSELAADIYGLDVLKSNIEDAEHNTTRFLIMQKDIVMPEQNGETVVTSFIFRVRNVPAALYKALGGFATNGINMTKLESYLVDGSFQAAQFYAEVEGHPESAGMKHAFEELDFVTHEVKIMGVYPAHPFRIEDAKGAE